MDITNKYFFIENQSSLDTPYTFGQTDHFPSLESAMSRVKAEMEKVTNLLLAADVKSIGRVQYASAEITTEYNGSCRWFVRCCDENGAIKTPALFIPTSYVKEKYKVSDVPAFIEKNSEIPYFGLLFARSTKGQCESFFIRDKGLPFSDSLAKKLIDDPMVHVGTHQGFVGTDWEPAEDYYLPFQNPECILFAPTVQMPVSDAINVISIYDVEVLFSFDGGFLVPVKVSIHTQGGYSISMRDTMEDILNALDGSFEDVMEFFEQSGNFHETDDGFTLTAVSADGNYSELEFEDARDCLYEINRALTSIRLVRVEEKLAIS